MRNPIIVDIPTPTPDEQTRVDQIAVIIRVQGSPILYLTDSQYEDLQFQLSTIKVECRG